MFAAGQRERQPLNLTAGRKLSPRVGQGTWPARAGGAGAATDNEAGRAGARCHPQRVPGLTGSPTTTNRCQTVAR